VIRDNPDNVGQAPTCPDLQQSAPKFDKASDKRDSRSEGGLVASESGSSSGPHPASPARVASQQEFGRELSLLRRAAGLTVRQVARRAALPASTAGDYFAGRHLPPLSQPDVLERIVRSCGITDAGEHLQWQDAAERARCGPGRRDGAAPTPPRGRAPYRGLASFQPADADWFFGREDLIGRLIELAGQARLAGQPLTVVGQSGSGKSSLLRAGLIPALNDGRVPGLGPGGWPAVLLTPGASPLMALARELLAVRPADRRPPQPPGSGAGPAAATGPAATGPAADPALGAADPTAGTDPAAGLAARLQAEPASAARLGEGDTAIPAAIIVDQFEQVFTACPDEAQRQAFIAALCALAARTLVVLGLRADCYGHALRYGQLAAALQERQLAVGPMSEDQLRRAILEPARRAGIGVSEGLVELLLRDLPPGPAGTSGRAAGALPLLSHALLATWERSAAGELTVADYRASGGIGDAIARTAEAAYGALSEADREQAHWLFLRLVQVSDDSIETRYRVPLAELSGDGNPSAGTGVLSRFVDERLITVTAEAAEITHDALLAAWPRLREWIASDREGLRIRRRITDAARAWADSGEDSGGLSRGGQLAVARDWAADPLRHGALAPAVGQFLSASVAHERATVETERRRSRRLSQLVAALAALVLVTVGLTGYAFAQRRAAMTAQLVADSRELAVEAAQLRDQDPSIAAQLSLAAYRTARTPAALASLLESSGTPAAARLADSADVVEAVALSSRRHLLAVAAADGSLRLWNVTRPGEPVPVGPPLADGPGSLFAVAFSPDGETLAAAGTGKVIRLWDVRDPRHPVPATRALTGPASSVYGLAFSPDGKILAAGSADAAVRLWTVPGPGGPPPAATGPLATLAGPGGDVQAVAFSPDGQLLAAGTAGRAVGLWNVSRPQRPVPVGRPLTGPARAVLSVAFSPDGQLLAAGSQDDKVWLWRLAGSSRAPGPPHPTSRHPTSQDLASRDLTPQGLAPLTGATDWVNSVAFSPDGTVLAAGSSDDSVRLWDVSTRRMLGTLRHPGVVTSVAWDGGHELASGCADGTVRLWTLPPPVLAAAAGVNSLAFALAGRSLVVASQDLEVWNPATRTEEASAAVPGTFVNSVAYARRSGLLAAGYGSGGVQLWRVTGGRLAPAGPVLPSPAPSAVESVAFSPDGQTLASGSDDGQVRVWDVRDPARPVLLAKVPDSADQVFCVVFSPDGKILAAASTDNLTRLWDIAAPARPVRLGAALRGTTSYDMSAAFSPDGKTLAIGSADKTVHLWDVADPGRPVLLGSPLTGPQGYVYSLAFSPDGHDLAAGITDDSVWLWNTSDAARPTLIAQLTGPAGHVYSVAFSPDGQTLAAGSADGTVRLWDTGEHAAASAVCATAGQPLTRSQWTSYDPGRDYAPPCPAP
jgi:WD40 repeat protein